MKHCTNLRVVGVAVLCLLATLKGHALCTLACNDQVQVSLDQTGIAVVIPDMILEGEDTNCPGPKTVNVMLPSGQMIGDTVTCDLATLLLNVKVTDNATGTHCWGTILVEDKLSPSIVCQDTIVHCTADLSVDSIGFPVFADNCNGTLDTAYYDDVVLGTCNTPSTAILTRTWHVVDGSGNAAVPCVQTITVVRPTLADVQFPLNFDNVQQPAIPCINADTSIAFTGMPMVDSIPVGNLCKITFTYEDLVVGACGLGFSVLRHWIVLDCCTGEIITHDQLIKVEDKQPPIFVCPDTLFFPTNGPGCAGTFLLPALPVSDICSGVETVRTLVPNGTIEGNGGLVFGLPMGLYTATYEAVDACGNHGYCEVPVVVEDRVVPVAVCDKITKVSLTSGGTAEVGAAVFDDGSYDECCGVDFLVKRMDEPSAPFLPTITFDCDDVGVATMVVVQVSDCHGNANTCMVTVLTEDKMAPTIACPADVTLACTEWSVGPVLPAVTGEPTVQENCTIDTLYFADQESLNSCHTGFVTRTFTAVDAAGFSAQCSQRITLVDNTPTTFIFPPDTLTDCSIPIDEISTDQVMALSDCEAWALNVSDETFPIPCGVKIFRTYTFLEWCSGADTSYTQFIEVRDTNAPVWDQPFGSKDTSYVCPGDLVKPGPPTARDFCSPNDEVEVFLVSDNIEYMGCLNRYVQTFVYTAMDTCGNVAEPFLTRIFVNDTIPPTANVPDQIYACQDQIPAFDPDAVDAFDNCPSPVDVVLIGETMSGDSCMGQIVRTYRITDICGQSTDISQNFIWKDTIPPTAELTTLGPFPCLEFVPDPDPTTFLVTDNCKDDVTVTHVMDSTNVTNCAGLVWRTWQLTDACGNIALVTQILTVLDTIAPVLNCPSGVTVPLTAPNCSVSIEITVNAVDNCMGNTVTITNDLDNGGATASGIFGAGQDTVTFFAMDVCGNSRSCIVPINITESAPPTAFCEDIVVSLDTSGQLVLDVSALVAAGLIGGDDLCTDVTFALDYDTLGCAEYVDFYVDSLGVAVFPYLLTVTDESGNSANPDSTCQIFLSDPFDACDDDPLVVGGLVLRENGSPMPQIETRLIDGNNMTHSMTSSDGWYHFPSVPAGVTCVLKPYKDDGIRNGVTTYDLIKITKHILGEELLDSPYKIIAADANNSRAVTTFDVVLIRKVILHVGDGFPNNTSWRFVRASYSFPDRLNPFIENFPEEAWLNNVQQDVYGHNFIGIKVGDVNGSASAHFSDGLEERGGEALPLAASDRIFQEGETAGIPIFAEGEISLEALQATIGYDADKMTFSGIQPGLLDIKETDYAHPKHGSVTLSWMPHEDIFQKDTPDGRFLQTNDVLFTLQFHFHESTSLSEVLAINSTLTPAIAYTNGGNPLNVNWRIHEPPHTMAVDAANFFELLQNRPNPFRHETNIVFWLKEKMPVRLEVTNMAGIKMTILNEVLDAGWQEVILGKEQLGIGGIYFYQLITPYGSERRKMVVD